MLIKHKVNKIFNGKGKDGVISLRAFYTFAVGAKTILL